MIIIQVIYFDYGGSHSSVVAAHIHAGKLESPQTPSINKIVDLPYFDKISPDDFGKINKVGTDADGNDIYVLGPKSSNSQSLLTGLIEAQGLTNCSRLIDTLPLVNNWLRIGGWLSRTLSLPALGRPLIRIGILKAYPQLVTLVREAGETSLTEVLH